MPGNSKVSTIFVEQGTNAFEFETCITSNEDSCRSSSLESANFHAGLVFLEKPRVFTLALEKKENSTRSLRFCEKLSVISRLSWRENHRLPEKLSILCDIGAKVTRSCVYIFQTLFYLFIAALLHFVPLGTPLSRDLFAAIIIPWTPKENKQTKRRSRRVKPKQQTFDILIIMIGGFSNPRIDL